MLSIIEAQRQFFFDNHTKPIEFRITQLKKLKKLILENEALLHEAIYKDFKKSEFDSYTNEIGLVISDIDESIKHVKKWAKPKRVGTNLANFPGKSMIYPEPLGVSLVIGAWNYPFQLSLAPVIASMSAGNTIILKPSELPQATSQIMAKLINENFPEEYFHVIEGAVETTTALLEQKFNKIFFTGSVPVGKIVYQAAAKHLTPVTLELGGKSPAIFMDDADLNIGVKRLVWAKFLNAGQTCVAPDYVFVHENIKQKFLQAVKDEIEKSEFDFEHHNYVQIINERNVERLEKLIDPKKVFIGGKVDKQSRYIEPTVMQEVTFDDAVMQDEIFGPILPVLTFSDLDQAIIQIKSMPEALSCYVYTKNKDTYEKIIREVHFGGGAVNDSVMHLINSNMGFGGVGQSGIGAYHGEQGFRAFTHYKSVLIKSTWFELNLKYYKKNASKLKWAKRLLKLN